MLKYENIDPNLQNKNWNTNALITLLSPICRSRLGVVNLLLNHKNIDINLQLFGGQNPLIFACSNQMESDSFWVWILLSHNGLNLNLIDRFDRTALINLFINSAIHWEEKLKLFKEFLTYKYCKLDFEINKIYDLLRCVENEFDFKEVLNYYKSPNNNFYKFTTNEYFNINFIYLSNNVLKRKYHE